jgi:hypothetical protein
MVKGGDISADNPAGWKCYINGKEHTVSFAAIGIGINGVGINKRPTRSFTG